MRKKGLIFIVIAAALYWGYVYFFKANRAEAEKAVKKAAKSTVTALYRANKNLMQATIDDFYTRTGRYPGQLKELVSEGFMAKLPGGTWDYDPETGRIK